MITANKELEYRCLHILTIIAANFAKARTAYEKHAFLNISFLTK